MNFNSRGQRGSQPLWNLESTPFVPASTRAQPSTPSFEPSYQDYPGYSQLQPPSLGPTVGRAMNFSSANSNFYNPGPPSPTKPSQNYRYNSESHYTSKQQSRSRPQYQLSGTQSFTSNSSLNSSQSKSALQSPLTSPRSQSKAVQTKYAQPLEDQMQSLALGTPPIAGITPPHQGMSGRIPFQSFFVVDSLRHDLIHKNTLILKGTTLDSSTPPDSQMISHYHSFYPLESSNGVSKVFGLPTSIFKCHSLRDSLPYALVRVDSPIIDPESAIETSEMWKQIQHSGIVTLREVLRSSLYCFFVYDYHPGAQTLESKYMQHGATDCLPEEALWSIIVQLVSAIQCIHEQRQACRGGLSPSKILITSKNNRIRINCVAIEDIFLPDETRTIAQLQSDDLIRLGRLIVNLACKSNKDNIAQWLHHSESYSESLNNLIITLLNPPKAEGLHSIDEISVQINSRIIESIEKLSWYNDQIEKELAKEVENGRLFRLLLKLGFITERPPPEGDLNSSWSETGDRYLIKLFRDYVFHQVYIDQSPVLDFAHVVSCLSKLDAGASENVLLQSRNEKSLLVVRDLKKIITDSFTELVAQSQAPVYDREWKGTKPLRH